MPRWLIPAVYVVVSFLAAELIPRAEYAWLPVYGHEISVSTSQALLGAIASGMMAFTAIVFSVGFLFIQYTATAYSKRFILQLSHRPTLFHAFGVFVATFTFALGTLTFVNRKGSDWVPFFSIVIVGALLLASIVLLALLVNQVAELRVTRMLTYVGDHGRALIALMPETAEGAPASTLSGGALQSVVHSGSLRFLSAIDKAGLVELARGADATIQIECAIGDSLLAGSVVARVYGRPIDERALLRRLVLHRENFYDADVRFSLRLLVDTAIMALSPAVNDPTTAVQALDQIEDLILRLGKKPQDLGRICDADGRLRLIYLAPSWNDYLSLAFDEIRRCGGASFQVARRLRAALIRIADSLADDRRDAALEYRRRLDAEADTYGFDAVDRATALGIDPQGLGLAR